MKLRDIASVIRSKNAGPHTLTIDVLLPDKETFVKVYNSKAITRENIANLYKKNIDEVKVIEHPESYSIKVAIQRTKTAGNFNDTDIYGTQQHAPMLDIVIQ